MIELIKTVVIYVGGLLLIFACLGIFAWAWGQPAIDGRDLAALAGFLGIIVGQTTQFLWTQATNAAQAANVERQVNAEVRRSGVR